MASKVIRNITKVFRSASGVLFGRVSASTGHGEELTPSDVRTLLSVYTISQTDTAISTAVNTLIGGSPGLLDTLDELAASLGDEANFASTVTTALAGKVDSSSLSESIDDRVAALLVAGTNIALTYNDASNTLTVDSTSATLSGTGSVDNAALRADGTGDGTLQSSPLVINDLATASPNNLVNVLWITPTGGTTNVGIAITPKGTGSISAQVPDSASTGGNVRGTNAVDWQSTRSAATKVASGICAVISGGSSNQASGNYSTCVGGSLVTASGLNSVAGGVNTSASGSYSVALGAYATAGGTSAFAIGNDVTANGTFSHATGSSAKADRFGQIAHSGGSFVAAAGDSQWTVFVLRAKTTDATPVNLKLDLATTRLTIPSGKILFANVLVSGIKSDGSTVAAYKRKLAIKNVGGTTSLVGSVETIGTDIEDNASTDVAITADNTNDALDISVTGIAAETWRWVAIVEGLEIAYGT